ncbi:MAG: hypothetical protein AB8I08_24980 [Sandaracinaceae bacterium]
MRALAENDPDAHADHMAAAFTEWGKTAKRSRFSPEGPATYRAMIGCGPLPNKLMGRVFTRVKKSLEAGAALALVAQGHSKAAAWLREPGRLGEIQVGGAASGHGGIFVALGELGRRELTSVLKDRASPVAMNGLVEAAVALGIWDDEMADVFLERLEKGARVDAQGRRGDARPVPRAGRAHGGGVSVPTQRAAPAGAQRAAAHGAEGAVVEGVASGPLPDEPRRSRGAPRGAEVARVPPRNRRERRRAAPVRRSPGSSRVPVGDEPQPGGPLRLASADAPVIGAYPGYGVRWAQACQAELRALRPEATLELSAEAPAVVATKAKRSHPSKLDLSKKGLPQVRERLWDADVRAAVVREAKSGTAARRRVAEALLALLDTRDPQVVALEAQAEAALAVHADDIQELLVRRAQTGRLDLASLMERGDAFLAGLALRLSREVAQPGLRTVVYMQKGISVDFPVETDLLQYTAGRIGGGLRRRFQDSDGLMLRVIADGARFYGTNHERFQGVLNLVCVALPNLEGAHALWLEALGDTRKVERGRAVGLLVAASVTPDQLAPYFARATHARGAAEVASKTRDPRLLPFIERALDASPSRSTLSALEDARAQCGGAPEAESRGEGDDDNTLSARLVRAGDGRKKTPDIGVLLRWKNGVALSDKERRGLLLTLTSLAAVPESGLLLDAAAELDPDDLRALVRDGLLTQPYSGKAKDAWVLYGLGALALDAEVAPLAHDVASITYKSHTLAVRVIEALSAVVKREGPGFAFRGLLTLTYTSGKRRQLARRATRDLAGGQIAGLFRLYEEALARSGPSAQPKLGPHVQNMACLGRPYAAAHLEAWLAHEHVRAGLIGFVFQQGSRLFRIDAHQLTGEDGKGYVFDAHAVRVAHPARMDDAALERALALQGDDASRLAQLTRTYARVDARTVREFVPSKGLPARGLYPRLSKRGYRDGEYLDDANAIMSVVRAFSVVDAQIEITHNGPPHFSEVWHISWDTPFDADDPALVSEAYVDLHAALGRPLPGTGSAEEEKKGAATATWGMSPGFPSADLAPSNRAKCVHSGDKILKGEVRVIIEREIDTPHFRGTRPGYLRPENLRAWCEAQGFDPVGFAASIRAHSELDDTRLQGLV